MSRSIGSGWTRRLERRALPRRVRMPILKRAETVLGAPNPGAPESLPAGCARGRPKTEPRSHEFDASCDPRLLRSSRIGAGAAAARFGRPTPLESTRLDWVCWADGD